MADLSTDVAEAPADVTPPTTDESLDTEVDFENDDDGVTWEDGDETEDTEEESESETQDTEPAESKDEPEEGDADEQDTEPEQKQTSEEERKAFNAEMAQRRIAAKQERQQSIEQKQNEYLAQAEDPRDLAVRQLQIDAYANKVDSNTNKLTNSYERALKDFDILSSDDPAIKGEIDEAIDAFQARYVKLDGYGNPTDVSGDLYAYLQSKADSIEKLTGLGARQQTINKGKEKSKTFTPPSRTPKQPKGDPDMESFEEEAARW